MADNTNELFMEIERANRISRFAIGGGIKGVLLLIQLIRRMEREGMLKGGEVTDFRAFLKATEGKYDIMNIPYLRNEAVEDGMIRADAMERIKGSLDAAGIRYCVLPDLNPGDFRIQVAVFRDDAQKFSAFYTGYLRSHLSGGEMAFPDLLNFTDGSANIISFPDEAKEAMKKALDTLHVDYASLPDLNLKDGEFQLSVAGHNTDTVLRAYKLYQEGLLLRGETAKDAKVMSEDQYQATACLSADAYAGTADEKIGEKLKDNEHALSKEKQRAVDEADGELQEPDWFSFRHQMESGEYVPISVDCQTLVDKSSARIMMERYPQMFLCRIPGTSGTGERLLAVSKPHVFLVQDAAKPRFIVFLRKDEKPRILGSDGTARSDELFPDLKSVLTRFDTKDVTKIHEKSMALLTDVPFPAPVK